MTKRPKINCFSPLRYRILLHALVDEQHKVRKTIVRFKKNREKITARYKRFVFNNPDKCRKTDVYFYVVGFDSCGGWNYFDPLNSGQRLSVEAHKNRAALEQARRFVLNMPSNIGFHKMYGIIDRIAEYIPMICDSDSEWYCWSIFYIREFHQNESRKMVEILFQRMKSQSDHNRQAIVNWYSRHKLIKPQQKRP